MRPVQAFEGPERSNGRGGCESVPEASGSVLAHARRFCREDGQTRSGT